MCNRENYFQDILGKNGYHIFQNMKNTLEYIFFIFFHVWTRDLEMSFPYTKQSTRQNFFQ